MNRYLLAALVLVPAIPGIICLAHALQNKTAGRSTTIIVSGALTMAAGIAAYVTVAVEAFTAVASTVSPNDKALALSGGLDRGTPAQLTGLVVGGALCVMGALIRPLFLPKVDPKVDKDQPRPAK